MALQEEKTNKGNSLETRGPSMQADGLPPNPSDAIFQGRALPIRQAQTQTMRRPFSEVTKSPLHFDEGRGTDERVSSRRPGASPGASQGEDQNKYSHGPNVGKTLNGVEIRGT